MNLIFVLFQSIFLFLWYHHFYYHFKVLNIAFVVRNYVNVNLLVSQYVHRFQVFPFCMEYTFFTKESSFYDKRILQGMK